MRWIARRIGVSEGHLTRLLDGERRMSDAQARAIADILGLPIELVRPTPTAEPTSV